MTPQEADSCDRETNETARAGTTAHQTSAALSLFMGLRASTQSAGKQRLWSLPQGKAEEKILVHKSLLLNNIKPAVIKREAT